MENILCLVASMNVSVTRRNRSQQVMILQARLADAAVTLSALRPEDSRDAEHKSAFANIMAKLTSKGSFDVTTAQLANDEASAIAREIVALACVTYAAYSRRRKA